MKIKLSYLILALAFLLPQSCIFDDVDAVVADDRGQTLMVTFSLDLQNQAMTRADSYDWGDNVDDDATNDYPEDEGNNYENTISPSDLMVFVYETDGTYRGQLPIMSQNGNTFSCALTPEMLGQTAFSSAYKFMVLANSVTSQSGLSYINGLPDLAGLTFSSSSIPAAIPMWGVTTYTMKTGTDGSFQENQTIDNPIYMLRAVAKVGVKLSQEMMADGYSIVQNTPKLNYAGSFGYCVPGGWNTAPVTTSLTHDNAFNAYGTLMSGVNDFSYADGTFYMYVPETANSTDQELALGLDIVRLNDENEITESYSFGYDKGIRFRKYDSAGNPTEEMFNIARNHYYDYTISNLLSGNALSLTLTVNPWNVDEEEIEFTDEVSVRTKMTWENVVPNTTDPSILYINGCIDEASAAVAEFEIDTPEGATWYASFDGDKDAILFLDEDGNKVSSVTGVVGEPATLKVVTNAVNVDELKSVSLKVVVITMDGRTIMANAILMPEGVDAEFYQLRQNLSI